MPPTQSPLRLDAEILSRMRSEVTSRSNWANDSSTFRVSRPIEVVRDRSCHSRQSHRQALPPAASARSIRGPGWCRAEARWYVGLNPRRSGQPPQATPTDRANAYSPRPSPQDGRPADSTPGCETGDDEKGERALAGRMRYANGCEADQRRDHAGAQSRRRFSRGAAAQDRSSPAAWLTLAGVGAGERWACRYLRSRSGRPGCRPPWSSRASALRRLRTTPARKPRTECCCQPVAFIIASIVAPWVIAARR